MSQFSSEHSGPAPAQAEPDQLARWLNLASEMAGLGAWSLTWPEGVLSLSSQAAVLLGLSGEQPATLEQALAQVPADDRPALIATFQACIADGQSVDHECRVQAPGQRTRWLRIRAERSSLSAKGAAATVRLDAVCHDITTQQQAAQALQETETRFRALVEGLEKVSVQGYDSQRRVFFWNAASESLYGYRREEALGQQLEDLIIPPAMREAVIEGTRQWLASGVVSVPAEELVLRHKDGSAVPVFSSHSLQRSIDGEPLLYCVDVDLSERVAAEASRHALEARLREAQKLEALGTMAGGIAHDFNNVLGAVLANTALARESLPAHHPALNHLELIARGGRRARGMVHQILSFSRRQAQSLQVVDVAAEVRGTLALLQADLSPGVSLRLLEPAEGMHVSADSAQLQQVLMNLCSNALQALPATGGSVELALKAVSLRHSAPQPGPDLPDGHYVCLSVTDTGCGMDAATRARVFEPFFTTKAHGQGTGLGLSVVHGIVLAHGGAITLSSEPGGGCCFQVYWPRVEARPTEGQGSVWGDLDALAPPPSHQGVIYVDDDEVMRLTAQALLERAGYRVFTCASIEQAMQTLNDHRPAISLLVTDYNMPDADGLSLIRSLRELHPELPLLLSSGYVTDALLREAAELGVGRLLQKERLHEDLLNRVRELLQPG